MDHLNKPKILIVEDEPTVAAVVRALLRDYDCDRVATLSEALSKLPGKYSLVVLDLALPDSMGAHTYTVVREKTTVPILVFTGNADASLIQQVVRDGGAFITKGAPDMNEQIRLEVGRLLRAASRRARERTELDRFTEALEWLAAQQ